MRSFTMFFAIAALCAFALPDSVMAQGDHLITVSSTDGFMRTIDPVTGLTLQSIQIATSGGLNAQGCNGLSLDPVTGQVYVIVRDSGSTRKLAVLNPVTGFAAIIGAMSDAFAGLAFRADGVLFAVTGDGANTPETLYTINLANAQATLVMPLGNGTDGETIAFGTDGFLYHASGLSTFVFERINTFTNAITGIPLSGYAYLEMLSLTLWAGGNLLGMDLNDDVVVVNTNGVATFVTALSGPNAATAVKGSVFVPSPQTQAYLRTYGFGCPSSAGKIPLFAGRVATAGGGVLTENVDLLLAPGNAPGLVAYGLGSASIPVPSFACQIQINPFSLDLLPITTDAAGKWSLSVPIPARFPAGDIYVQVAVLDGTNILLSNPLQAHFP